MMYSMPLERLATRFRAPVRALILYITCILRPRILASEPIFAWSEGKARSHNEHDYGLSMF